MDDRLRNVAVAVATRNRPTGCQRLVLALLDQELAPGRQLRILVVDNGTEAPGLQLPDDSRLRVLAEPTPGIPFARNRGVDAALPWADAIAFIDDDEVPLDRRWLERLISGLESQQADVVSGPVQPRFPAGTPRWLASQPVFQRHPRQQGAKLQETYTGNTAARSTVFTSGLRFDPALRQSGGSDTLLFRTAHHDGASIRWVADAAVIEFVDRERVTTQWVLRRSFRIGANRVQLLRGGPSDLAAWRRILVGSALEIGLASVAPVTALLSRHWALRLLGRAARGSGTYATLLGARFAAYR